MTTEKATLAAGCFWGVETAFRQLDGVVDAIVGYTGGTTPEPTYEMVCTGRTGHAEAVQVDYDPERITFDQLLDAFWDVHDPTTVDRQGPDIGTQYRSVIFCHDPDQERAATAAKTRLDAAARFADPIATQIATATEFHRAEEYHQRYFEKRGIVRH